ncbi:MAG: Uma2 family endonuclease [Bacteroidota bacterium]
MQTLTIDRSKVWTIEDYLQLDVELCQLIDGNLVMTPAPNTEHQRIIGKLHILLHPFLGDREEVLLSPIDVFLNKKNIYQPDIVFVARENSHLISKRGLEGAPDLIIEVISPSNSFIDRYTKKKAYFKFAVKEYWIVDPANKSLEIYLLSQKNRDEPYSFVVNEGKVTSTIIKNLNFDLRELF